MVDVVENSTGLKFKGGLHICGADIRGSTSRVDTSMEQDYNRSNCDKSLTTAIDESLTTKDDMEKSRKFLRNT